MEPEEAGCFDDLLEPARAAAEQARARLDAHRTNTESSGAPSAPAGRQRAPVGLAAAFDQALIDSMRRLGDPAMTQKLDALAKAEGRAHLCARCCIIETETRKHVPNWTPNAARSWVGSDGRRHWSTLCPGCERLEADRRKGIHGVVR